MARFVLWKIIKLLQARFKPLFMIVSGFYDCVYALQKYRSHQKISVTSPYAPIDTPSRSQREEGEGSAANK